jgi:hypothetical protein
VENQNTSKIRYKYDKADFESMRDILNIDWRTILLNKDIDEQWTVFVFWFSTQMLKTNEISE